MRERAQGRSFRIVTSCSLCSSERRESEWFIYRLMVEIVLQCSVRIGPFTIESSLGHTHTFPRYVCPESELSGMDSNSL